MKSKSLRTMLSVLAIVSLYTVTVATGENETSTTPVKPKVEITVIESTSLDDLPAEQLAAIKEQLGAALGETIILETLVDTKDFSGKLTPEQLAELEEIINSAKKSGVLDDEVITKSNITFLGVDKISAPELEKARAATAKQVSKALKESGFTDEKMVDSLQAAIAEAFDKAAQEAGAEVEAEETE